MTLDTNLDPLNFHPPPQFFFSLTNFRGGEVEKRTVHVQPDETTPVSPWYIKQSRLSAVCDECVNVSFT